MYTTAHEMLALLGRRLLMAASLIVAITPIAVAHVPRDAGSGAVLAEVGTHQIRQQQVVDFALEVRGNAQLLALCPLLQLIFIEDGSDLTE